MQDQPQVRPLTGRWVGESGGEAPPPFVAGGNLAVPIEAAGIDLVFEADAAQQRAAGRARLRFTVSQTGRPLFDLVQRPTRLAVNGQQIAPERLRLVTPPDESTHLRMLDEPLAAGDEHTLEIEFPLRDATVQFGGGGVRLGLFMTDLDPRGYLERHAPANLEFDQVPMSAEVRISGGGGAHRLFTNGSAEAGGAGAWRITFPDYFTSSSCYLHVTDRPVFVREALFAGAARDVPLKAYGARLEDVTRALRDADGFLRELEETYGPYAHEALLIYCTGEVSGGMEYAGATMTSLAALGHEITHSWFARGVMPANGNAGWIDEAVARWRDRGYPRAASAPARPPVTLSGFSPYRRHTPFESYAMGSLLLSELDALFSPRGLRPLLAELFRVRQRRLITTPFFQTFLERETGAALGPIFDRYVYGKSSPDEEDSHEEAPPPPTPEAAAETQLPPPPRAFTNEQLRSLL